MGQEPEKEKRCALCNSRYNLTFHHLIPRTCHKNKRFKKQFTREEMTIRGIIVCRRCHSFIHKQFSEKQLGRDFNTLEALQKNATIRRFVVWAKKQHS